MDAIFMVDREGQLDERFRVERIYIGGVQKAC